MQQEFPRLKVMTVVGTRPEIIRLSRVISKFDQVFDHVLVHTGQNYDYELNQIFFEQLGIPRPKHFLEAARSTPAETMGAVIQSADKVIAMEKPDAFLVLGDTNSCLAALPAKRRKIPVFHMEAGNRCFDFRVPEEINRRLVDHLSDVNLPYTTLARDYLISEGLPSDLVIKTGSPMFEVLSFYEKFINESDVLNRLNLSHRSYFLVSLHREENVDDPENFSSVCKALNHLCQKYNQRVIFSAHPRTQNIITKQQVSLNKLVEIHKPFGFFDFVNLQLNARVVLSDSGTITEESSILNFPAVNVRNSHERPEGFEEGAVVFSGTEAESILRCVDLVESQSRSEKRQFRIVDDYTSPNVSEKMVRIVASYTPYVNWKVWRKRS